MLARVHARYETPAIAIVLHGVIAMLLAISGTFASLAMMNNVAILVLYFVCCVAAFVLMRRDTGATRVVGEAAPLTLPLGPVIPLLACAGVALDLLANAELREYAAVAAAVAIASR